MNLWTGRLVISGAALLFFAGWGLLLVSGDGGNSSEGSEAVRTIGALMLYASFPTFVIAGVCELVAARLTTALPRSAPEPHASSNPGARQ